MASTRVLAALILSLFGAALSDAPPQTRMRGSGSGTGGQLPEALQRVERLLSVSDVEASLHSSLAALLGSGDSAKTKRMFTIEASVWQTYQALPKNAWGRLGPKGVRHAVHTYFAKEHGWLVTGLEPHGMLGNATEVHEVSILQDRAPHLVEALLETRNADRGLSLGDIIVMIAEIERLIFDESRALLDASYTLNGQSPVNDLSEEDLHEVLRSYLMLFSQGSKGNLADAPRHQAIKAYMEQNLSSSWQPIVEFEQHTLWNYRYAQRHSANPFQKGQFSPGIVSELIRRLLHDYGKWQNSECREMKEVLMDLDADGDGRVALGTFYSQQSHFTESVEYLRKTGALEEFGSSGPHVRLVNYLLGPSNCIAASSYYSVCCLNECEGLMSELEREIRAPKVSPERLLDLVANLSSSSVDAPRALPEQLRVRLWAIAERHGGEVPIHGRLFAQWLHHAFPSECPYPVAISSASALTQSEWDSEKDHASQEERSVYIEEAADGDDSESEAAVEQLELRWSEEEVLPVQELQHSGRSLLGNGARLAIGAITLVAMARAAAGAWRSAAGGPSCGGAKGKTVELPLYC